MVPNPETQPVIDIPSLPDISLQEYDFHDTSFFQSNTKLPSPAEILRQHPNLEDGIVTFEHLNLVVKVKDSRFLRLEEAQTLRAVRHAFPRGDVPVPEVFGWRIYYHRTFLYMSLVAGKTLRQAWPCLTKEDKKSISAELGHIVTALRQVSHGSSDRFVGSINRGTVQDRFFRFDYEHGPFPTIKSFNDWLLAAAIRQRTQPGEGATGPYREFFSDTGNIYLTHGDLTLGNIIVSSKQGAYHITGIIDWEQAGWYPEYWEYCKLLYGVEYHHEWRSEGWADKVMEPFEDEFIAFAEYCVWRSP
ncbi:hypothetical protein ACRALDRAFT_1076220 [Sodiomyces alcalophilus JCM 7366]|uniref:uncharacterized protein n=1 Tax=Sodiomyces alcalophilus JCM 7366 TaxID=591952 RepID=UPI0039B5E9D3